MDDKSDFTNHIKCMNSATEPDPEQRIITCPLCKHSHHVPIDFEGVITCPHCDKRHYTQPPRFLPTAHLPNKKTVDGILDRPAFAGGLLEEEKANIKRNRCPLCNRDITEFRDALSEKEFHISGICQECQDKMFGVD